VQSNHKLKIGSYAPLLATNSKVLKDNHQSRGSLTKHGLEQQTTLKCLRLNARSSSKLTWADHLDLCNNLLVSMDTINVKRNDEGKRKKRKNDGINRRKDTLIKKAYELGEFDGIDVALDHSQAWSVHYVQIQGS
jgi:hypothetical protein